MKEVYYYAMFEPVTGESWLESFEGECWSPSNEGGWCRPHGVVLYEGPSKSEALEALRTERE